MTANQLYIDFLKWYRVQDLDIAGNEAEAFAIYVVDNGLVSNKPVVKITDLKMTCDVCPTQWEGTTITGSSVYIRYRWGNLRLKVGGIVVADLRVGDYGSMTDEEMLENLKDYIEMVNVRV